MRTVGHVIAGVERCIDGQATAEVFDPATGAVTARVCLADREAVDEAVASAGAAFATWRHSSLSQRSRVLFAYRDLVARHRDDLADLVVAEHGKVRDDARGEVTRGLEVVEFACGIPHLLKGEHSEGVSRGVDCFSVRESLGVCVGITPFNFPVMVPLWLFPLAIACGNSFVLKPSERDPSPANLLAELFVEAGLPDGVLNVVHGDKSAVNRLLEHPEVMAVSSVGSTPVARSIYQTATRNGKRVQALGGAKNHMVVLPDADLAAAAAAAIGAGYGSAGERCMAISVVVAVGSAAEPLIARIADALPGVVVGPGGDASSQMGPLITAAHRDRVRGYVEEGLGAGAELVVDGRAPAVQDHAGGFFLGPSLFDRVDPGMSIYRDEIFGPVLSVVRVDSLAEAIDLVNANPYGNGTAIFTRDGAAARTFQRDAQVGMIGINVPIPVPMAYYSFGGWRDSLFGDAHVHGREGVAFYTRGKVVTARWGAASPGQPALSFPTAT